MNLKRINKTDEVVNFPDDYNDNLTEIEEVLGNHTHEIEDVVGLQEELASGGLTLTNLIVNGDFSDGTNKWANVGSSTTHIQGGVMELYRSNAQAGCYYDLRRLGVQSNITKVYIFAKISPTFEVKSISIADNIRTMDEKIYPNIGEWYNLSSVSTMVEPHYTCIRVGDYGDTSVSDNGCKVDSILALNLTQIFGAGNEPSKEEMDKLIETLGVEYFEEITVTKLQAINWLLKLESEKADKTYVDNQDAALTSQLAEKVNKAYKVNPTSPTLLNNFMVGLQGCIYYQSDDGTVCVQGAVANTSLVLGATIFQFPVGLRPLKTLVFTGVRVDIPDVVTYITTSGEVKYMRGGTNGTNITWASLSQIRFKAGV